MLTRDFRHSSAAGPMPSSCIYVRAAHEPGFVDVLDSKTRIVVTVSEGDWGEFLSGVKAGEFDLPLLPEGA